MSEKQKDVLDRTETFLAKRDGIDKVLKVLRYSSKLALASSWANSNTELKIRLSAFEASVGTSRKAYRLGKWLQNLNAIRKQPINDSLDALILTANIGEGIYYFVEQLTWLVKSGMLDKKNAAFFTAISAWAEVLGYVASLTSSVLKIQASLKRESNLSRELLHRKKDDDNDEIQEEKLVAELRALESKRMVHVLAVIQDCSDALLTLPDLRGGKFAPTQSKAVLATAGLVSAAISMRKTWLKT